MVAVNFKKESMKKPFKNPIEPREKKNGIFPWSFAAPSKDQSMSGTLSAGDNYGVGFNQPVGKKQASSVNESVVPQKSFRVNPNDLI